MLLLPLSHDAAAPAHASATRIRPAPMLMPLPHTANQVGYHATQQASSVTCPNPLLPAHTSAPCTCLCLHTPLPAAHTTAICATHLPRKQTPLAVPPVHASGPAAHVWPAAHAPAPSDPTPCSRLRRNIPLPPPYAHLCPTLQTQLVIMTCSQLCDLP